MSILMSAVVTTDSEGIVIPGAGLLRWIRLPTGQPDNPAFWMSPHDSSDPLLFYIVALAGRSSDAGTPSSANFSVMLTDGNGALSQPDTGGYRCDCWRSCRP